MPLPELTVAVYSTVGERKKLSLAAPLATPKGPFELASSELSGYAFSPNGTRLAYLDGATLSVVDSWPPQPRMLQTVVGRVVDFRWLDSSRLVLRTESEFLVLDLERGAAHAGLEIDPSMTPYLLNPSPDARWFAFAADAMGQHQVWIVDISQSLPSATLAAEVAPGELLAWFDWAPDSRHLAYATWDGRWLHPYSISTGDVIGEAVSIHPTLEADADIPTFRWAPTGDSLSLYYQRVPSGDNEAFTRLYWVDMRAELPGSPILLSDFTERYWVTQAVWSPTAHALAFQGQSLDAMMSFSENLYVVEVDAEPGPPMKQHPTSIWSLAGPIWAPDAKALYYIGGTDRRRVYRANLQGQSVELTQPNSDVWSMSASSQSGCIAYHQLAPARAIVVVDERGPHYSELRAPESNRGLLNSSGIDWVDAGGRVRGILYQVRGNDDTDVVAWAGVDDCKPNEPVALFVSQPDEWLGHFRASTALGYEERN